MKNDDEVESSSQQEQQLRPRQDSHSSAVSSSSAATTAPFGLGAPVMDRAMPDVPLPPFIPLPRDECFIDIGGDTPPKKTKRNKRRRASAAVESERFAARNSDSVPQNLLQEDDGQEEYGGDDDYDEEEEEETSPEPVAPPTWPYVLSPAANEFILERPDPSVRSYRHRLPNADRIRDHFRAGGKLSLDDAMWIIQCAQMVLLEETNVLELKSPVTVCGDVHGQFFDLLTLLELGGSPTNDDPANATQYLFLGDYVDRGSFSTEVALLLLSYKLLRPQHMWLLRGNHECRHLTAYFNFKTECCKKYNEQVYDAFMNCFDALPLAARIDNRFLCVHGGLGPDIRSVEDIALIQRVMEPPARGPMCDLLWADPMEPDEESAAPGARFLYNDIRSCSYSFSYKATVEFLKANNLLSLIRAHESQFEGYRMFQKVPETGMPSVICIFSAPNYCEYNNKAAIIQLADHSIRVKQFAAVEHPYVLQNFLNAFTWSIPFLLDKVQHIVSEAANMSPADPLAMAAEIQRQQDAKEAADSASSSQTAGATAAAAAAAAAVGSAAQDEPSASAATTTTTTTTATPTTSTTRPLLNALIAHGGAKAMANDVLAAHHEKLRKASGTGSLDGLLSMALKVRAFMLLPKFLRRRGKVLLIKVRAVVWFRLFQQRQQQKQAEKKDSLT